MARKVSIRSGPSKNPAYVRFVNRTARKVSIKWFDYTGGSVDYGDLNPNESDDIITFEGHPWKGEDSVTKTRLFLNKTYVFYATPKDDPDNIENSSFMWNSSSFWPSFKGFEYVYITLPVLSLLELSSEVILKNVRSQEDISLLKLPTRLQTVLQSKS